MQETTDASILALQEFCASSLRVLDVSFCRKVSEDALGAFTDECEALTSLVLWGCTQVRGIRVHLLDRARSIQSHGFLFADYGALFDLPLPRRSSRDRSSAFNRPDHKVLNPHRDRQRQTDTGTYCHAMSQAMEHPRMDYRNSRTREELGRPDLSVGSCCHRSEQMVLYTTQTRRNSINIRKKTNPRLAVCPA